MFGLTWFALVSQPGVVGDDYVLTIHAFFAAAILGLFCVGFIVLRWATGGATALWSTGGRDQVGPVLWMILAVAAAMLTAYAALDLMDSIADRWLVVSGLLAVTLIPAAFLLSGRVRWPGRLARPGNLALVSLSVIGIGSAAAWSWAVWSFKSGSADTLTVGTLLEVVPVTVLAATMEEVMFRLLLLTALLDRTGSRFQAVFLSSVAFGLMHVPGVFAQSVAQADWQMFQAVAQTYVLELPVQIALGLFLGVLWLRSGSLVLIAATHALFNLGAHLTAGL